MSLRARLFELWTPEEVDRFLETYPLAAIFKASTTDKTFEGFAYVEKYLSPREDVAVGLIRIPDGRPASNHVAERTGIKHQSPQFILFRQGIPLFDLDNYAINPEKLVPLLAQHLPAEVGERVNNPAVAEFRAYRDLLEKFISGQISEERFQWAYLDRLREEASWRSDEEFGLLNSLFENPRGRDVQPALLVGL